ncbi:VOC family protein [Nocardiopsis aegyptia]|uniref:VOC domain-containing protein n=1 Tax=Nocardiopsis aegyptia TaxID=220378 RepID=A0A7Z0J903_9ACTN|nr:VOC family protein [Nocardiopsis aegyptia]NYJ33511.1 hypothetical protein [Nocardiopsis aegyptia]
MGRLVHAEITVDDLDRAARFYASAFDWTSAPSPFVDGYRTVDTGPGEGIDCALMSRAHQSQAAVVWLEVEDMDAALERVAAAGGTADHPVHDLPGRGRVAYVNDSEGNLLGLKEPPR